MRPILLRNYITALALVRQRLLRAAFALKSAVCLSIVLIYATPTRAQVDSTYIASFPEELALGTYFYYQYTNLIFQREGHETITYRPNSPIGIGLSFAYKSFALGGGMGFSFLRDKKHGDTKVLDLQYHYFGRNFTADLFLQRYKGYFSELGSRIQLYPDISVRQYGLHGEYVFNYKKFSYRAAFNQSERQLKSTGSFHLGGGLYYNQVRSDSTLSINSTGRLNNYQLSITGGYGYNWVITDQFFLAASLSLGVNFGTTKLQKLGRIEVSPSFLPRVAAGYNGKGWSVGIWYVLNSMYVNRYNSLNMRFNTGYTQVTLIKRFDRAPKFMKKIKFLN